MSWPTDRSTAEPIEIHFATRQDLSAQPRYAATLDCVMRVGLIRFHRSPPPPASACDYIKLQTFFDGAGLAVCCEPRRVGRDIRVGLLLVRQLMAA
jgi:hypothetical protein